MSVVVVVTTTVACQATTGTEGAAPTSTIAAARTIDEPSPALTAPAPTAVPDATVPTDEAVEAAVELVVAAGAEGPGVPEIDRVALSGDLRQGWVLLDALRLVPDERVGDLSRALATLTGQELPEGESAGVFYGDLLLAWDVPAPPDYLRHKAALYADRDGGLARFFDGSAVLDWRLVSLSGTGVDAGPALQDPEVGVGAEGGAWLDADDVVYGIVVAGEARAYPARVLAVHGVVDDSVGGRPVVLAHCRSCGATLAYDRGADAAGQMLNPDGTALELAASGLLDRGSPLLYDRDSGSLVGSMDGVAVSGRLGEEGRRLAPISVRTTTWGAWSAAFPDTTVVSDDAGIGRVYVDDADLGSGTDVPAWPVGPVDGRLGAGDRVLGVPGPAPLAFAVTAAESTLAAGTPVVHGGVRLVVDGGGLAAVDAGDGTPIVTQEANWLAWSQFHPATDVWAG